MPSVASPIRESEEPEAAACGRGSDGSAPAKPGEVERARVALVRTTLPRASRTAPARAATAHQQTIDVDLENVQITSLLSRNPWLVPVDASASTSTHTSTHTSAPTSKPVSSSSIPASAAVSYESGKARGLVGDRKWRPSPKYFACQQSTRDTEAFTPDVNQHITRHLKFLVNVYEILGDHWRQVAFKKAVTLLKKLPFRISHPSEAWALRPRLGEKTIKKVCVFVCVHTHVCTCMCVPVCTNAGGVPHRRAFGPFFAVDLDSHAHNRLLRSSPQAVCVAAQT